VSDSICFLLMCLICSCHSERAYAEEDDDDMLDPYADVDEDMNEKGGVSKMADVQLNAERFFAIANAMLGKSAAIGHDSILTIAYLGAEPDNVNPSNHDVKKPSTMIQVLGKWWLTTPHRDVLPTHEHCL
jgi:hypothetical protein